MTEKTDKTEKTEPKPSLTNKETAFLIRAFWEALLAPKWSRDHLIELGKAVFAKLPLASLSDAQFAMFMPHLQEIAQSLASRLGDWPEPSAEKKEAPVPEKKEAPSHG